MLALFHFWFPFHTFVRFLTFLFPKMDIGPLSTYSHKTKIGDYTINYVKVGTGPTPIFCFSGLMASPRYTCAELIERFEQDGHKFTFYAWDPPGYFASQLPVRKVSDISFSFDIELAAQLLKFLGHSKWVIMGWSAGGQEAIQFTSKYPEMVEKLIVWGAWDLFEPEHLPTHRGHRDLKEIDPEFLNLRLSTHNFGYEEFEQHWHAWIDMIEREHFNQDYDIWIKKFKYITCPTLIIAGSDDPLGPLPQAKHIHQHIESSRLEIINGAPHCMQVTHTEIMYGLVCAFLS